MIKKVLTLALAVGLVAGALQGPALAKKKPKATPITFYLHGQTELGENDSMAAVNDVYLPMDSTEPSGSTPKSRFVTNYLVGPNTQCAGNTLFPIWNGKVSGHITGDLTVTLNAVSTPGGQVDIRIWPDVMSQACSSDNPAAPASDYIEPVAEAIVDVPPGPGQITATIKGVDFAAVSSLTMQLSPTVLVDLPSPAGALTEPWISRVLYDTPDYASSVQFSCTPNKGSASCI